ncbi:uncharacterized protein OCT59_029817 [Rhizophagus irregularis]|uniref:Uncharacterized protein n=2 Tax=Rhizophagus irregularis TaxID=588596 RepID=A0A015KRK9_RHIIW|nr:hypothetical protein GLOIN_2v1776352 [Rhizophagus irregularis DAOM 181602=DAOM 197198]EXX70244.1 hypothetical protein RirG_089200 [Rhizophagus irregularis DAOM 197198w]POG69953.1 hypothetical protein GLOIN_2v1776352 [Rhizophagus irregularis DAOM 181602=DAOM 197198]UZO09600.1 hypothetical protein OCT59_029817 [Rhizophagus irregularis]GBC48525.1 hypothetical protein GLOIN_2v1776352 [Rhizophagus irregularis DAOM 181602=DAOM 197198]|eukprot:XP_025176819.1 hypothetical protein GLOIN_2v1776352 [Rhizophagus irregularis DAOM 181602=DAOM 197198]
MTTLKKLEETQIKKIFDKFDYNGNSILSLAEIDKAVLELYPHFSKNKPVIMRAYKAADISKDGYIELSEFNRLIEFLYYYDELFQLFKKLDKNNDNRISLQEFKQGHKIMGLEGLSNQELKKAFDEIDVNHGGYILFDEFCMYAAKKKLNSKGNPPKPSSRPSSVVGSVKGSRPSSVVGSVTGSRPSSVVGSVTGSVTESKKSSTGSKSHETKGSISGLNVIDDATSVTSTSEFADFTRDDIIIRSLYKLSEDLTNFLTKSKEFDVKIIIGKESDVEEFQAHSSILQARSAYFNAALSKKSENNKTEEDNSTVSYFYSALSSFMSYSDSVDEENITIFKKENISPKIFRIVLDYIYGGAVGIIKTNELSSPEFLDLLETCEELGIQGFSECLQPIFLENHHGWIQENLITLEKFSSKREAFHEIQRYCLDQLCQDPDTILKSEDPGSIDKKVLLSFLSRDDLIANEIDLWNFIIKWGITQDSTISKDSPSKWPKEDFSKLKANVNDLIPLIRFKWITSDLFFQQVRPYKWLFDGDIYETLMESYMMGNSPSSQTNTPILQNPSMVLQNEPKAREKNANLIINENLKYGSLISSFIDKKPFKPEYPSYVFKLVYRGTSDHFSCAAFHEKCDNLANTLTIARIRETGELIGGYNPEKWKIAGRSVKATYPIESKKAFIFKIEKDKIENSKLSRVHDHYNALRHKKETGPNFCDLIICNKTPTIHYEHRFYDKELKINGGNLDDFEVYRIFPKQTK